MQIQPVFILGLLLFLIACGKPGEEKVGKTDEEQADTDKRQFSQVDSWATAVPDFVHGSDVPKECIHVVDSEHELIGLKMLDTIPIILLSRKQAEGFGDRLDSNIKRKPYLVRTVVGNRGTGGYFASVHIDSLVITHGSLGHHAVPMGRSCIVIDLKQEPRYLFINASVAE